MEPSNQLSETQTDAALIDRVRRGEVQAYGLLVERYERAVLAAVLPTLRDAHAAQDVVQDVFVLCFTKLGSLRDASRFGPWLLKTAGREAVHASRRAQRMRIQSTSEPDEQAGVLQDEDRLLNDERERLLQCVRSLPAHERVAVSLRYFEGRGVNEIARITGRAVGTITKQLSRAIERLRGQLTKDEPSWKPKTKLLVR
jgi:RNA polymerase sigma-70 factor (ECF subfamily)